MKDAGDYVKNERTMGPHTVWLNVLIGIIESFEVLFTHFPFIMR